SPPRASHLLCALDLPCSLLELLTRPTLFPYTTLFRSRPVRPATPTTCSRSRRCTATGTPSRSRSPCRSCGRPARRRRTRSPRSRSEEHTSELQSRENLVCRLLLEKKKNNT